MPAKTTSFTPAAMNRMPSRMPTVVSDVTFARSTSHATMSQAMPDISRTHQ